MATGLETKEICANSLEDATKQGEAMIGEPVRLFEHLDRLLEIRSMEEGEL